MNKYRAIGTMCMITIIVLALAGCGTKETVTTNEYNQYQPLFGISKAETPQGLYLVTENHQLHQYTENGEHAKLNTIEDCETLFYYKDKLSYSLLDDSILETNIHTLDANGKEQGESLTVDLSDDLSEDVRKGKYTDASKIVENIYLRGFWEETTDDGTNYVAYITDLDDSSSSEEIKLKALGERTAHVTKITGDWVVIVSIDLDSYKANMVGYNTKTKQQKELVSRTNFEYKQDWISDLQIKGEELYWYEYGTGLCKKNIQNSTDVNEKTVVIPSKEWVSNGFFSSDYVILCQPDFPGNNIPEDEIGISFYSYDGGLVQFFSTPKQNYVYCMETKGKIYLTNQGQNSEDKALPTAYLEKEGIEQISESIVLPTAYIEKLNVKDGNGKIKQIPQNE